jgi:hypothetical protein
VSVLKIPSPLNYTILHLLSSFKFAMKFPVIDYSIGEFSMSIIMRREVEGLFR